MTNAEAITRALDALAAKDTLTVANGKAKARPYPGDAEGKTENKAAATAAADAEAWNMLKHLAKVL